MKRKLKKLLSVAMSLVMTVATVTMTGLIPVGTVQAADSEPILASGIKITQTGRVAVHDPSIVYGNDGYYYIFGSHMAWAKSRDLTNWSTFHMNINNSYRTIFSTPGTWAARGGSGYDISGNLWAPDVIYNEKMGKYCMYMSVNGNNFCSSIALATADKITGPYTYVGTIVYSGFTNSSSRSYTFTDYQKATGSTNISRFLLNGEWNSRYGTNAIDPCVKYDENGDLWMSYGSWFGGIYMLKLDPSTGLRDYSYKYETVADKSDAYMGIKIAGGYGQSGEGSYIVYDEESGYYYLYLSYCGLDATDDFSGYHLRMYRSENITGPYRDAAGNSSIYTSAWENQSVHGIKLFGNYAFSSLEGNGENSANGYMSGGHNSAFIDSEGNHFLIYHTRFNVGQEWHEVRAHQQFLNEDGWLVTAPYEYRGSKISETGYDREEIIGSYELINHGLASATQYTGMLDTLKVILSGDGTIAGDVCGTWSEKEGSYYADMNINGVEYKGVFFKQYDESSAHREVMTFSLIGEDNTSVWGSKIADDTELVISALDSLFSGTITGSVDMPSFGDAQVTISTDSDYFKVSSDGTKVIYQAPENDISVAMTARIVVGGTTTIYVLHPLVKGYKNSEIEDHLGAFYEFDSAALAIDSSGNGNNLTVYGVTGAEDEERGSVAYFDGGSDYMKLPARVTDTDDFTFMAWVKSLESNSWERIFDFGDGEGNSLFLTSHGYTPESIRAAYAINSQEKQVDAVGTLVTNQWVHLAVTVDSAHMRMNLYINGKLAGTTTLDSKITDCFKGTKNYLGKSQYSADAYFKGYMDDVAICGSALSADEIQNFMENKINKTSQVSDTRTLLVVVSPGEYVKITGDGEAESEALYCVSSDQAVAKICGDNSIHALSEGSAKIQVYLDEHSVKNIMIRVEKNQDVIYGDVDDDGRINVIDMEHIQKHLLGLKLLSDRGRKAAGINSFDGNLSVLDMESIQKHILGIGTILQF